MTVKLFIDVDDMKFDADNIGIGMVILHEHFQWVVKARLGRFYIVM